MIKIFNSSINEKIGYIFDGKDVKVINKETQEELSEVTEEILKDAAKSYIKNDVYGYEQTLIAAKKEEEAPAEVEKEEIEVCDDVKHHLDAIDFGEYLIVIGDYSERDFDVFVGSKQELNDHIAELHLNQTPKVYALKQLQVKTKYEVL